MNQDVISDRKPKLEQPDFIKPNQSINHSREFLLFVVLMPHDIN